jgi:flagellar hook-length control protein FliK
MMQVGGLGYINSMGANSNKQTEPTAGFANILEGLTAQEEAQNEKLVQIHQRQILTKEEIAGLIDFLQVQKELNEADELVQGKLEKFVEEVPEMEVGDVLPNITMLLPFIELEQIQLPVEKDYERLLKTLKLLGDLIQDEGTNAKAQDFLQEASKRIESLIHQNKLSSRMDLLNKIVTPLAKELNEQQTVIGQKNDMNFFDLKHRFEIMNVSSMLLQQMARPEQLTLMANSTGKPVSAEGLIQQFQSILAKSQFGTTGGAQKLFIKLNPENLGALRIELVLKDSTLFARIQTTTSMAKDMLESQLQNLKNAFHSQNIVVDKVEISQQLSQHERFFSRDPEEQPKQDQQGKQERNEENDQPQETSFLEALLNVEA